MRDVLISDIHLLDHADYLQIERPFTSIHPIQENLRYSWESRGVNISNHSHHILMYLSSITNHFRPI